MSSSGRFHKVDLSPPEKTTDASQSDHEQIVKMRRDVFGPTLPEPPARKSHAASERVGRLIEVSRAILRSEEDETLA